MSRQRYEKEIEEILERTGETPAERPEGVPSGIPSRRRRVPVAGHGATVRRFGLKFQYALIAGIALIVIGAVMQWLYFFFAGVALVAAGYVIYYRGSRQYRGPRGSSSFTRTPRMWRGRSIDQDDDRG